jgi:hypothetical protein
MQGSKLLVTGADVQPVGASGRPVFSFVRCKCKPYCTINGSISDANSSADDHIKRHQPVSFLYPQSVGTPIRRFSLPN